MTSQDQNPDRGAGSRKPTGDTSEIQAPRLTPQGRTGESPEGTDATSPTGSGAKTGQPDKAEG